MTVIRPATADDIPTMAAILAANDEPIDWPGVPGRPYLEHLLGRAGTRLLVATEDDRVIGFAGSIAIGRPGTRFLTDLFVDPASQDHGAGRLLFDAAMAQATGLVTFSSSDPRALARYIRAGMRPSWPVLYLGVGRDGLPDQPTGLVAEPADAATTARWSTDWTGLDRRPDHDYHASLPGGAGHLIRAGKAVVGLVWSTDGRARPGRTIQHALMAPDVDPVSVGVAVLRAGIGTAGDLTVTIPGPHPVVPVILERGGRIEDCDTLCTTDPGFLDPDRIFPSPALL